MGDIKTNVVVVNNLRVEKLREYLMQIIDGILTDTNYQINANMLSADINNYSLDKIPVPSVVEKWIMGPEIHKDVFAFRSRNNYSQDTIENLLNVGFFEVFENIIKNNNENNVLPDIPGIQSIKCLNCGSMNYADTNTAEFEIQIQIEYMRV